MKSMIPHLGDGDRSVLKTYWPASVTNPDLHTKWKTVTNTKVENVCEMEVHLYPSHKHIYGTHKQQPKTINYLNRNIIKERTRLDNTFLTTER